MVRIMNGLVSRSAALLLVTVLVLPLWADPANDIESAPAPAPVESVTSVPEPDPNAVTGAEPEMKLGEQLALLGSKIGSADDPTGRLNMLISEAGQDLAEAKRNTERLNRERSRIANHDERVTELQVALEELRSKSAEDEDRDEELSDGEIEKRLIGVRSEIEDGRKRVELLKERAVAFGVESAAAAERLVRMQAELSAVDELLRDTSAAKSLEEEAQRLVNRSEKTRLASAIALLRFQLENRDQLEGLLELEMEVETTRLADRTALESELRERLQLIRQVETRETRKESERVADRISGDDPERLAYAERTTQLARELETVTQSQSGVVRQLTDLNEKARELSNDYEALRKQVESFGSSVAVGRLLLLRRGEVLADSRLVGNVSDTRHRLTLVTERRIDLTVGAEGRELGNRPNGALDEDPLYQNRRKVLDDLVKAYRDQSIALTNLLATQLQFQGIQNRFTLAMDEWLIGTRTSRHLGIRDLPLVLGEMLSASKATLVERYRDLRSLVQSPSEGILALFAAAGALMLLRRPINRYRDRIRDRTRRIRTDRIWFPLVELLGTLVRVSPLPLVIFGLGWLLDGSLGLGSASGHGFGFRFAGVSLFVLMGISDIGREQGLGPVYLKWNREWCRHYRRELRHFTPLLVFLSFLAHGSVSVANARGLEEIRGYLFVILIASWIFVYRLLRSGSAWMEQEGAKPDSWIARRRYWVLVALSVPILFGGYALMMGYGYTVGVMLREFGKSVWVWIALTVIRGIVERALSLSNRKLRLQQSLKRMEENRERSGREDPSGVSEIHPVEEPHLDLQDLGEKASRLVGAVFTSILIVLLWSIWTQSIPLFETLDSIELPYSKTVEVAGVAQSVPMTISDLVLALVILILTIVATVNLPGLLEILILPLFNLDRGARYAIATLTQYTIFAGGVFLVFTRLGFEWSSIQWLIAALGVGLGFGLQEIVANFVSGIIILFERPVRVGDLVTVGDTSGIVSKIRIRATTILNWDKQELLVPNKEFITGRLLNWTLSDPLNRIVIPIGVAYGTDTRRALEVLGRVAAEHPAVLDDPAPLLTFEGFGDSALNLILRCYLRNYDGRLDTITELHHRIREAFDREGIEIAFPQLDLHLRSGWGG